MSLKTLEIIVEKALTYSDYECTFMFQGGEPTLVGLEFYEKLIEFQNKYNNKNIKVYNAIQTNGININEQWAMFFHEHNFLVGISLDGPKEIHDRNRMNLAEKSTFNQVMKAIGLLDKYQVEYNILSVISGYAAKHAQKIYSFFKRQNFKYLQFIPCLDPLDEVPGTLDHSLTPENYTIFLKESFDQWYRDIMKGEIISIRYFDNLLAVLLGHSPEACGMSGKCSCQFVTEANGNIYPCDFYVTDNWYLGNIAKHDFEEIKNSQNSKKFIEESYNIGKECRDCKWFNLCRGGCKRYKEPMVDNQPSENYFCTSYKEFFDYAYDRLYKIASMISQRQ